MAFLKTLAVNFGRITTLVQVILYLPLTLDVAGQDAFLALSAALACYYAILSTIRLLTRRTRLRWIGEFLAIWQFLVIPVCLLLVFNVYSPPKDSYFAVVRRAAASAPGNGSDVLEEGRNAFQAARELRGASSASAGAAATGVTSAMWRAKDRLGGGGLGRSTTTTTSSDQGNVDRSTSSFSASQQLGSIVSLLLHYAINVTFFLARHVPPWWHTFLRWSSPIFSLLEGIATLLVIQVLGSLSRWCIASALSRPPMHPTPKSRPLYYVRSALRYLAFGLTSAEALQLVFLLASALTYCTSAVALYASFDGATRDRPGTAAAIGAAVSSTLWLTGIAFALRKGNVVETSLMFAYVTWNVYQLSDSLNFTADPLALIRSFQQASSAGLATETLLFPLHINLAPWVVDIFGPLMDVVRHFLRQTASFIGAAGATLPKSVIVSLIYRLMVLYLASRILPLLKSGNGPQEWSSETSKTRRSHAHSGSQTEWKGRSAASQTEGESDSEEGSETEEGQEWSGTGSETGSETESVTEGDEGNGGAYGMALGGKGKGKARAHEPRSRANAAAAATAAGRRRNLPKRKEDDEPFGAFVQFIVAYSRLTLIAVYSHLLLLDQSNAITWRFLTVSITIGVWFCEIALGTDDAGEAWR